MDDDLAQLSPKPSRRDGTGLAPELLERLFAHAPSALQVFARDGRSLRVNARYMELFGAAPPPGYNLFEDQALAESGAMRAFARALGGERASSSGGSEGTARDPARRAIDIEIIPLRGASGEVEHLLCTYTDATGAALAQERAEALAADAEQARLSAQHAVDHASFLAEAGRLLSTSLDYETTLGQVARLATPRFSDFCIVDLLQDDGSLRRVAAVHADERLQPVLDELCRRFPPQLGSPQPAMRVITSGQPELLREVDAAALDTHTVNGLNRTLMETLAVRSHLAVPLVIGGRTLGAISLGFVGSRRYRITDVPLAEALASRAAVAIQNARLYREASEARSQAESANRTKDEFLAMLGHELRNPLAPIVTALELTREREGPSRERDIIERQVQHVRRLVDDLLDVARIARGKLELALEPLEIALPIQDGVELARPLIQERRHQLKLDVPEHGLRVFGDRTRLSQVMANLLTNAARYSEPGASICVSASVRADHVVIVVQDTGAGIAPELLPRIYELFEQGKQTVERGSGGLGLGLSIVKALVERHGGEVHARSEGPGRGSEFELRLPRLISAREATPKAEAPRANESGQGARILIVDDNEDAAVLLAEALSARGYRADVAHDPREALAQAQRNAPDLALLDIGLPGIDGYELARLMRADSALGKVPLVALTGYGQAGDRARSAQAGFAQHLVKPVNLKELSAVITRLLAQR
jgi:signal transduction histidine kinase/ActR/RegA family two-component response regulator